MPSTAAGGGLKVPIVCGDLKEAITIFDRETLTVDISNIAGKLWETDQTGMKVRERLDIQTVDEEAIIMAEHFIPGGESGNPEEKKTYTQTEIEAMTKADILALATRLGYTMTTTDASTKEQIVSDFMAQQAA